MNRKPIVIDNGSGFSKAGFAGESQPQFIIPSLIGLPEKKSQLNFGNKSTRERYIGDDAIEAGDLVRLISPISGFSIDDWTMMEDIWNYIFYNKFYTNPSDHPLLLTEEPLTPPPDREKEIEIMFETFNIPSLYLATTAELALYASGRKTGCIIDIGHNIYYIVPVYESFALTHAIGLFDIGGRDVTEYLGRLLRKKGFTLSKIEEMELVRKIKEDSCYISLDPEKDLKLLDRDSKKFEKNYTHPNGETIKIEKERFLAPECLFNPSIIGKSLYGLADNIVERINCCEIDIQREFYENIILIGGSTMFPGLKERLIKEIRELFQDNINIEIFTLPNRKYLSWIGGSKFASSKTFKKILITKEDYKEIGPKIGRRCVGLKLLE
ncbi:MAG: actin, cytoplasmic 2 [Candidatus Hodarchaeota archaeon]